MTSLDFLHIALGGGFILLVIFLCVLILHLTLVLRDVSKISANVRDISDKLKETVFEPLKAISEMTAGIGFVRDFIDKIRAKYEAAQNDQNDLDDDTEEKQEAPVKEKNGFSIKKLKK